MYLVDENKFNRLLRALDAIGERGLTIHGSVEEREFVLSLGELKDSMGKTLKYKVNEEL